MNEQQTYRTIDKFDRMKGALENLPDVTKTKPSTISVVSALIGENQTFIIETYRQREQGDTVFVQYIAAGESIRLFLPPAVAEAVARQRDSLTTKVRRKVGRDSAAARKARGELPGFMKGKRGGQ
jgi:hypothetical protein